jgi:hypothetical protein
MGWFGKESTIFGRQSKLGGNGTAQYPDSPLGAIPNWGEKNQYIKDQEVMNPATGLYYRALSTHYSTESFANDLAAAKWVLMINSPVPVVPTLQQVIDAGSVSTNGFFIYDGTVGTAVSSNELQGFNNPTTTWSINSAFGTASFVSVSDAEGNLRGTKAVVNISSAQILTLGTAFQLLPAPGAGKYYDIKEVILEYTQGTTPYTLTGRPQVQLDGLVLIDCDPAILQSTGYIISNNCNNELALAGSYAQAYPSTLDTAVTMKTSNSSNPTLGDGNLRVIIYYNIRTFGA